MCRQKNFVRTKIRELRKTLSGRGRQAVVFCLVSKKNIPQEWIVSWVLFLGWVLWRSLPTTEKSHWRWTLDSQQLPMKRENLSVSSCPRILEQLDTNHGFLVNSSLGWRQFVSWGWSEFWIVLLPCLFVGGEGDCKRGDRNLSVVTGFGLCVNGWTGLSCRACFLRPSSLRREAEFPRAVDEAGDSKTNCGLLTFLMVMGRVLGEFAGPTDWRKE